MIESVTLPKPSERDKLLTLFELGREVTSVLELDELLPRIPELIARIIAFDAFAVFLQERRSGKLRIAYAT
ncbi:MAG: serine/threonine protein phosphatase, partial [Vicinamibacteraceae bacterium]|nr:serine/threonine protein phosphatase [Vicinamibacteraceae bacterium]